MSYLFTHISEGWPPEVVAKRIMQEYPDDLRMRISHENHVVIVPLRHVPLSGAVLFDHDAGPAFRHLVRALDTLGRIPSARRA